MKKDNLIKVLVVLGLCIILVLGIKDSKQAIIKKQNQKFQGFISEILDKYPDIKKEDLIDILNSKEASYDLSQYGIYPEDSIIDYSLENHRDFIKIIAFLCMLVIGFSLISYINKKRQEEYMDFLIRDLEKISKGNYHIKNLNQEGDFAKLQTYIYKLATLLKKQSDNAQAKKNVFKNNLEDISHQIKTPLASINLLLDNLEDEDLDPLIKKEIINDIKSQTSAITNLVLMLLKISSLEAKVRPFFRKDIKINDLVDNALQVLKPEIEKNNINFILDLRDESFYGDYNWEKEVYINLIKNAIEHGEDNIVQIRTKDTNSFLQVEIINKGSDINLEDRNKIFNRFFKSSKSENNFGIGLNLTKLIVEEDNGKISLDIKNGYTIFTIKYFKRITI